MKLTVASRSPRRGIATVELALLLPFLLMLILGSWEVGRLIQVSEIVNNAAREGGRLASTGQLTASQIQSAVCLYMQQAGLPNFSSQASTVVSVSDITNPGTDPTNATELDKLQVTVSIPFSSERWIALYLVTNPNTQISATSYWYSAMDMTYPTSYSSPQGY
jgi:Flp pilus assembly protein TadG